jgi:hypothetical protein
MLKLLLPLLFVSVALAADPVTPPAPPECLTRPVTLGSVTLSCVLLDTDPVNGGSDFSANELRGGALVFQVRLSTTDPDVIGFRVGVTYLYPPNAVGAAPFPYTVWGTVGKSPSSSVPQPAPPAPYFRYTFLLSYSAITGIQIQELKPSSSQTF